MIKIYSARLKTLFRASSWVVVGAGIQRFAFLILGIAVAKTFGQEAFGQFALIQNTTAFAIIIATAGLSPAALKFLSEFVSPDRTIISRYSYTIISTTLLIASTIAVVIYTAAPWISHLLFASRDQISLVRVMCGILFFSALYIVTNSCLQGLGHYRSAGLVSLVGTTALIAACSTAILLGTSSTIYLAWLVAGALQAAVAYMAISRHLDGGPDAILSFSHSRDFILRLIRFSTSAAAYSSLWMAGLWLCNVLIANSHDGLTEVALFAAAYQWFSAMIFVPGILGAVVIPALASSFAKGDTSETHHLLIRLAIRYALVGGSIWAILVLISPFVLELYGERFVSNGKLAFILITGSGAFAIASTPLVHALLAAGATPRLLSFSILWLALLFFLIFSVFSTTATGVAASLFSSYAIHWAFCLYHATFRKWIIADSNQ